MDASEATLVAQGVVLAHLHQIEAEHPEWMPLATAFVQCEGVAHATAAQCLMFQALLDDVAAAYRSSVAPGTAAVLRAWSAAVAPAPATLRDAYTQLVLAIEVLRQPLCTFHPELTLDIARFVQQPPAAFAPGAPGIAALPSPVRTALAAFAALFNVPAAARALCLGRPAPGHVLGGGSAGAREYVPRCVAPGAGDASVALRLVVAGRVGGVARQAQARVAVGAATTLAQLAEHAAWCAATQWGVPLRAARISLAGANGCDLSVPERTVGECRLAGTRVNATVHSIVLEDDGDGDGDGEEKDDEGAC